MPPRPLHPAGSLLLDVVRFGAALAVAVGHLTNPDFSTRWPFLLNLAVSAVAIFFVLSGFVIRLVTTARPTSPRQYVADRTSRIYSVVVPAVVFTLVAALPLHFLPGRVPALPLEAGRTLWQTFANVSFIGSIWGLDIPVSFNSVFWSLCYECFYYALYGFAFFLRGPRRWLAIVALLLLAGPPIAFLMPLWFFGCALHETYQALRSRRHAFVMTSFVTVALAVLLLLMKPLLRLALAVARQTARNAGMGRITAFTHQHHLHLLQRASLHAYVIGIPAGVLILLGLLAVEHVPIDRGSRWILLTRRIADSTFTLYLFHLGLFMLYAAYLPYNHASSAQKLLLLLLTVAACVAITVPLDGLKHALRKRLHIPKEAALQVIKP